MNILIVDDQPNILSSLTIHIAWQDLGIFGVYTAGSALSAREILLETHIDILLTDIEMPVENGISLLAWVRKQNIELECIFLTSHPDFFYAQQAIGLGAVEYVIQPARHEDIIRAVENAKLHLLKKRKANELLKTSKFASAAQNTAVRQFIEEWPGTANAQITLDQKLDQLKELGICCTKSQPVVIARAHITHWSRLPQKAVDFLPQYQTAICSVLAYLKTEPLSYYQNDEHFFSVVFSEMSGELEKHLRIFQSMAREKLGCRMDLELCPAQFYQMGEAVRQAAIHQSQAAPSKDSASPDRMEILRFIPQSMTETQADGKYYKYFDQIRKYVYENMSRPITRMDIADQLYLSPDYINSIVKHCTGLTCKEYITHEKMNRARNMLETTSLPVGEVAKQLGYDSFAYFSKVYKAIFHTTPKAARK